MGKAGREGRADQRGLAGTRGGRGGDLREGGRAGRLRRRPRRRGPEGRGRDPRRRGDATYVHLDVTSESDWQGAARTAVDRYGALNVLVNNAAIVIPRVAIEDRTAAEWYRVMAVNAKGVFLGTKYAIPAMRRAGGGSIVNISSVAGIGQSLHQEPAYAASKGAIRIFTKVTASQHARDNIRCKSASGPGRYRDAPQRHAGSGRPQGASAAGSAGADGHGRRDRDPRPRSGLGRVRVHDRERAGHRRRGPAQ